MPALSNTFLFIEPQKHYLEYSAKVIHELIAQNRSAGQNIVELIGEDANPAKIKETIASLNPIVVSGVGHGSYCYSEDTEILTENGWKLFNCLLPNEKVASLDEQGNLKYEVPKAFFEFDYKGKMFHIDGKRVNLLVTPNHRMYVSKLVRKGKDSFGWSNYFVETAENLKLAHYKFKQSAKWNCSNLSTFELPQTTIQRDNFAGRYEDIIPAKNIKIEDWLRFFGIWLADGCINTSEKSSYRITITKNNEEEREVIRKWVEPIATALGCSIIDYDSNDHSKAIVLKNKQLFMYLKQFGKAPDKFIPYELKQLKPELLNILLYSMFFGDGTIINNLPSRYDTVSKRLADDVQELCLKTGKSATVTPHNDFRKNNHNTCYHVSVLDRDAIVGKESFHWKQYEGKIYCVNVSNGLLFVRRNGKPSWCGNSAFTVECTTMFMQKGDSNVPLMAGRVVHLNSCQTGGQLGPALVENGATAYVGSRESFWFYVGDAPNSSRAVKSPFLAEWQFDVSLLKGKTVAQAHSDMMQKYEEELTYWIEGEGKNHPDAGEIARILNINKSINTYLYSGQGETIVVSPSGGSSGEFNVVGMVLGGVAAVAIGWWLLK